MISIKNLSIEGIVARLIRIVNEIRKAVSNGKAYMNVHDIARLKSYINELKSFKAQQTAINLDVPHYHNTEIEVPEYPEMPKLENNSSNDVLNLLKVTYYELVKGQSKDDAFGLGPFDSARFDALMASLEGLVAYIEAAEPNDYPEASQDEADAV